ncbi:MAG TPA: serine/threonine-protein kinase [Kofleriaceae bacterium]
MDPLTPKKPRANPRLPQEVDDDHTELNAPIVQPGDGDKTEIGGIIVERTSGEMDVRNATLANIDIREFEIKPGMRLGEYQVEAKVGEGGMGVVYSAVHPLIGKRAAIKILLKELCSDSATVERFIDEARAVNNINHPNIVDVFAFGEMPDGRRFLVMEWLEGETLRQRIARSRPSLAEVGAIVKPLVRALQAAHAKQVIHRDLKPDNVFLARRDDHPVVKLLDFGIAKLVRTDNGVSKTATGAIVGTPQYIAPEQAKGYAIDHKADVYALGGIVFELLTGRPPFIADNAMEMVAKHLMEAPVAPSSIVADIPPELDGIVLRMLSKTPEGRPELTEVVSVIETAAFASFGVAPPTGVGLVPFLNTGPVARQSGAVDSFLTDTPSSPNDLIGSSRSYTNYAVPAAIRLTPSAGIPYHAAPDRTRPLWIALAVVGALLAGVIAFLIVTLSGRDAPTPIHVDEPTRPAVQHTTAEPARPMSGTLRISVDSGAAAATILVDGKAYSPDMRLPFGAYQVVVTAPGMITVSQSVSIDDAYVARSIVMKPIPQEVPATPPATVPPKKFGVAPGKRVPKETVLPDDDKGLAAPKH